LLKKAAAVFTGVPPLILWLHHLTDEIDVRGGQIAEVTASLFGCHLSLLSCRPAIVFEFVLRTSSYVVHQMKRDQRSPFLLVAQIIFRLIANERINGR
jgi:hypothetical protein